MSSSSFDHLPAPYDLEIVQGDDVTIPLVFKSGTPAVPMDLTPYTFYAKIKTAAGDIDLTVYVPAPTTGLISIVILKEQTEDLVGNYPWELDWENPGRRTILSGYARIKENV